MCDLLPLISIIVPVYKVEKYLDCCVQSILAQTYTNLEIILVDDGSPDASGQICDAWAKRDNRVHVIHKANGGASSARNAGLDVAKGEYIGFVDSDDYIDKDMYALMLEALCGSDVKIACCKSLTFSVGSSPYSPMTGTYKKNIYGVKDALEKIFSFEMGTSFWRRLFHVSVFDGIRFPEGQINEEYPLLVPITIRAGGTVFLEQSLYYYRDRNDGVTGTAHTSLDKLGIVEKNLHLIEKQLIENNLTDVEKFPLFAAKNAYFVLISITKNLDYRDGDVKNMYTSYLSIAKAHKTVFLMAPKISVKDKLIFILLLTGTYRYGLKLKAIWSQWLRKGSKT
jgi:glycosyltransferase involved in cell wall biosynthesis